MRVSCAKWNRHECRKQNSPETAWTQRRAPGQECCPRLCVEQSGIVCSGSGRAQTRFMHAHHQHQPAGWRGPCHFHTPKGCSRVAAVLRGHA